MKKLKNVFSVANAKMAAAGSALLVSANSFALSEAVDTQIAAAQTSGASSVTAVVAGLVVIVAVCVGLGLVLSLMKKA